MTRFAPISVLLLAIAFVAITLLPTHTDSAFDLRGAAGLPVVVNGRVKPLDTVARNTVLILQGRQRVVTPDNHTLTPIEWLLDVVFASERADTYRHFEIVHPDVLALFHLQAEDGDGKKRFSYQQLEKDLPELERQAQLAQPVEDKLRSSFQRAVVQLRSNVALYQRLKYSLVSPETEDPLSDLMHFQETVSAGAAAVRAKQAGQPHDETAARATVEFGERFLRMSETSYLLAVPPAEGERHENEWKKTGDALLETFQTGRVSPYAMTYAGLARTWRLNQPEQFNHIIELYRGQLEKSLPTTLRKCAVEVRFNSAQPFYTSMELYVLVFLLAVFSWLKWPDALGRSAFWLLVLAWTLATVGIGTRMWLENRPPVTNLYSSALFIGWAAVALCIVLESTFKNAIGSVAAGVVGFGTLLIAHHLSLGGDTMEMMRAVLDSNFWLGTHVVTVTIGYSATFLAGFLAIIYIVMGLFTPWLRKRPTPEGARVVAAATLSPGLTVVAGAVARRSETNGDMLTRMVYGIVCFATFFSFVGTVLGGIWADQSWGRFWGWDPKENGALIIVVWNAIILHARWGGMVKQRGLMVLAVFGNVVTSWSWFGTNMLGVGLHSYGFTDAAFWALSLFVASQLILIAIATLPLEKWRSFRDPLPSAS